MQNGGGLAQGQHPHVGGCKIASKSQDLYNLFLFLMKLEGFAPLQSFIKLKRVPKNSYKQLAAEVKEFRKQKRRRKR